MSKVGADDLIVATGATKEGLEALPRVGLASLSATSRPLRLAVLTPEELVAVQPQASKLIAGLLDQGGSGLITGRPKSGKSWLALFGAVDGATGREVLGQFPVADPLRVLFVEEEDSRTRLQERFRRIVLARDGRGPDGEFLRFIVRSGFTFASEAWLQEFHRVLDTFPAQWIIFDVLRSVFRGDVTQSRDVAPFLRRVDSLRDRYGAAVTLAHHTRKKLRDRREAPSDEDPVEEALGSTDLTAWADVTLAVSRLGDSDGGTFKVRIVSKDGDPPGPFEVVLEDTLEGGIALRGLGPIRETRDAKTRAVLVETLRRLKAQGVTQVKAAELAQASGLHRTTVTSHLPGLLTAGVLKLVPGPGRWPSYEVLL